MGDGDAVGDFVRDSVDNLLEGGVEGIGGFAEDATDGYVEGVVSGLLEARVDDVGRTCRSAVARAGGRPLAQLGLADDLLLGLGWRRATRAEERRRCGANLLVGRRSGWRATSCAAR